MAKEKTERLGRVETVQFWYTPGTSISDPKVGYDDEFPFPIGGICYFPWRVFGSEQGSESPPFV